MEDLVAAEIAAGLAGTRFRNVEVYPSLASTQTLLASEGGPDGRVVIADHQTAGRGRLDRRWESPPGRSLLMSVLLRGIRPEEAPLAGLAAGLAVARAAERLAGVRAQLKWPNDVLVEGRKVCGVLGEVVGDAVVVGIGVNVSQAPGELPPGGGALGGGLSRGELAVAILRELDALLGSRDWLAEYRSRCVTLGARVRVETGSGLLEGRATDVRDDGALVVEGQAVVAGDVIHVREAAP